ncbi:MAG: hypothetical protein JSR66_12170 [Proteobacteria bacterium]|nr:hypothetical protein [Pseudomonadota bacterium]
MSRGLAWHIFRKDWRLMWPLAVATALLQVVVMAVIHHSEPFPMSESKSVVAALLTLALAVTMTLLIVLTVQQEAIPSVNQDWLSRPVARRDLLIGKLLTVVLLVHGPIVLMDILQGLSEGFAPGPVLHATVVSNFEIALFYSLPVLAAAAMTRTVVEAIILGLVALLILVLVGSVVSASTGATGLKWIWRAVSHAELLLVTVAVLCWQYLHRSREATQQTRAVFAAGLVLFMLIPALPWGPAFALQRAWSGKPQVSRSISVAVQPGAAFQDRQILAAKSIGPPGRNSVRIALPLRFSGVPAGALLHADRTTIRLVRGDGTVAYRGIGHVFDLPPGGDGSVQHWVDIPANVYAREAEQPLRLELEYFATLLRGTIVSSAPLEPALRVPGFGWCAARTIDKGSRVEIGCREIGALPFCVSMAVGHDPEHFECELNYEPVPLRFSTDPMDHMEVMLPADEWRAGAEVVVRAYEPEDHFSREVVLPQVRLKDWRPAAP